MRRLPVLLSALLLGALLGLAAVPSSPIRPVAAATASRTPSPTRTPTPAKTPTKTPTPKKGATPSATPTVAAVGPVAQPPMPALYYGSITWFGATATGPLIVEALIDGQLCGWESLQDGGSYVIAVRNNGQQWGCGDDGETVSFRVNGLPANETATFKAGLPAPLSLTGPRMISTSLKAGCATLTSTWPSGTAPETVRTGLTPAEALLAFWIWDTAQGDWDAYVPGAPYASSLTSVDLDDPLWLCVNGDATYRQPLR